MVTSGITVRIDLQNEDYEKAKRAVQNSDSVGIRDGQAVSSTHIHSYINNLIKDAIGEYERDDPLADADVDVEKLTKSQKEALAAELE